MAEDFEERQAYVTHLRSEHKRLRECLDTIEDQWILLHRTPRAVDSTSQVLISLQALRVELARHFEEEESGGCIEEAVSIQPSLGHEATRLEQEHPELLGQLDLLIKRLCARSRTGEATDRIEQQFRRFAEQLHAHENAENGILEQSFGAKLE